MLLLSMGMSGCVALVGGTHQNIAFESNVPNLNVSLGGRSCTAPCTVNVRRQYASFHMTATRDGQVVVEGPIYRRRSLAAACWDRKDLALILPAFADGLLIIPGIVDLSTGITEYMPERVIIEEKRYLVDDPCFAKPHVGGLGQGFKDDGQE